MTIHTLTTNEGRRLNAQFAIERSAIVLHSRGGTKGKNETNPDYSIALRLLLRRFADNGITITGTWVDSTRVQDLPLSARAILGADDVGASPDELFKKMSARMQKVGRSRDAVSPNGNANKRIRLQLHGDLPPSTIVSVLQAISVATDLRSQERIPAEVFVKVTPEYIWQAVNLLLSGYVDHGFGKSIDFDLVTDEGARLPPKAVFGVAATAALNFKVMPKHFSGGEGSPCFRILKSAGYQILPKNETVNLTSLSALNSDEQWTEGRPKLVTHARKERGAGLAAAKKAEYRRLNGKLQCERCNLDPVSTFGSEDGEACIEVHHRATQVQHMIEGHVTKLEDLQCLCANCHRFVHRLLKTQGA